MNLLRVLCFVIEPHVSFLVLDNVSPLQNYAYARLKRSLQTNGRPRPWRWMASPPRIGLSWFSAWAMDEWVRLREALCSTIFTPVAFPGRDCALASTCFLSMGHQSVRISSAAILCKNTCPSLRQQRRGCSVCCFRPQPAPKSIASTSPRFYRSKPVCCPTNL